MMTPAPRLLLMTAEWPVPGRTQPASIARRQADALHAAGMSVEIFAFRGGGNPYNYAAAWMRLRPRLRAARYDLIHAHFTHSGLLALPKLLPLVVTLRESDVGAWAEVGKVPTTLGRLRPLAARLVAHVADAVIVSSEALRNRLTTATPVHIIPPGLSEQAVTAWLIEVYRSVLARQKPR